MKVNDLTPDFKMSYGVLMQVGDKGVQLIEQDQAVLAPYGVDAAFKTALTNQTLQLKDYPTDEELRGAEEDATAIKNESAEVNRTAIRTVMVKVAANFPDGSPKYNRFGTQNLSHLHDPDLAKCGLRVVRMLNEFLGDMPNFTQAEIDAFEIIATHWNICANGLSTCIAGSDIKLVQKRTLCKLPSYRMFAATITDKKDVCYFHL